MTHPRNTIRTYALVAVSIAMVFIMTMSVWLTSILSDPEWCIRALNAEKLSAARQISAFMLCKDSIFAQIEALAGENRIYAASIGIVLVALMIIVVAGGRVSFTANKEGVSGNLSRDDSNDDPATRAAAEVAVAAVDKASEIKEDAKP